LILSLRRVNGEVYWASHVPYLVLHWHPWRLATLHVLCIITPAAGIGGSPQGISTMLRIELKCMISEAQNARSNRRLLRRFRLYPRLQWYFLVTTRYKHTQCLPTLWWIYHLFTGLQPISPIIDGMDRNCRYELSCQRARISLVVRQ
jgi:hypothetical protein